MNLRIAEFCRLGRHGDVFGKRERASWATAMTGNQAGPTITKIRLRDDTQPLDFRVPLPATEEAIKNSYTSPPQLEWPMVAFSSDCPLHVEPPRA
jgi:hypothetical protein